MALSNFMIHRVTITRPVPGIDAVGGQTVDSETTIFNNIPACVQPIKAEQQLIYAQQNIKASHTVYTDRDLTGIRNGDLLHFNGKSYIITGVRNVIHDKEVFEVTVYRFFGGTSGQLEY